VIRGPTAGTIHGLTDDIPHAIHVLVPEGRRIKPRAAGVIIRSRSTRQTRNLEIGTERMCVDGFHLRVTNKARTVVGLVRWGGVRQHAGEAVRSHLADEHRADRLHAMADEIDFSVSREIVTLTEAIYVAWERAPA
jgi:predicted transcriptional regulator of viral defense system